jgi:hypothetical protein
MSTNNFQANAAYIELVAAATKFKEAIRAFKQVYNPNAVGLVEWCESIDETMTEIHDDINSK